MASLRASFEKELKSKLSQKATQFQTEEAVLLKSFKYFDLQSSGTVDKQQFIRTLEKLGLPVYNQNDYFQIFDYYDINSAGKLNYKEFIGQLFSNTTAQTRNKSPTRQFDKTTAQFYRGYQQGDSVQKFSKQLKNSGPQSLLKLAVSLQAITQGSNYIDFNGFIQGNQEYLSKFSEDDLREVFDYFDKNKDGKINIQEFFEGIKGPLSSQRRGLIQTAFIGLDSNQQSVVAIQAVKGNYNARLHPDVRVGKKTEYEVLQMFLKQVDLFAQYKNIQDGNISNQEFEELFSFISSNIDNDTYFELLMKSTFNFTQQQLQLYYQSQQQQITQQQQQLASPYCQYQSKQNQEYYNQTAGQIQQLNLQDQQQNLQNQQLSNQSVISSQSQQNPSQIDSQSNFNNMNYQNNIDDDAQSVKSRQSVRSQQSQRSQVSQASHRSYQSQSQQQQQQQQQNGAIDFNNQDEKTQKILIMLADIRKKLNSRGARGFIGIQRQFRIMDDDYDMKINFREFKKALKDYKINLSDQEFQDVFCALDMDNSGKLDIDELVRGIRGPMNKQRQELITQVFNKLDRDQDGIITVNDIKGIYSVRYHPDVKKGVRSEDEVLGEFLETFELHHNLKRGTRDQRVNLDEFLEYYNNVSSSIDDDEYFRVMIQNAYRLNNQNINYEAFSASPSKNYQQTQQRDYRSQITQNAPFGTSINPTDYSTNLRPQSAQVQKSSILQEDIYKKNPSRLQGNLVHKPAGVPSWPGYEWKPNTNNGEQMSAQQLLEDFKQKLKARGVRGILSLGKFFKIADKDNSGYLNLQEFQEAMNNLRLTNTEEQNFQLFQYFDRDRNQQINYNEFLRYIRGDMNKFRRDLTMRAFQKFDKDHSGFIDINDLKGVYSAQNHPDVQSGKKTEEEVLGEFLDTFEINHAINSNNQQGRDQVVTWDEFAEYYQNISASIDDDRYFEIVVKTAWRLDETNQQQSIQKRPYF